MRIIIATLFLFTATLAFTRLSHAETSSQAENASTAKPQATELTTKKQQATTKQEAKKEKEPKLKLAPNQTAVYVEKMHCGHCAKKIVRKVITLKGVQTISTDVKLNLAVITPQNKKHVNVDDVWKACQAAGFQPVKLIGPEGTFAAHKKTKAPLLVAKPQTTKEDAKKAPVKSAAKPVAVKS